MVYPSHGYHGTKELRTGNIAIPEQASTVDLLGADTVAALLESSNGAYDMVPMPVN